MSKRFALVISLGLLVAACGPRIPVLDLRSVPEETMREANHIRTYYIDSRQEMPEVDDYLGPVDAYSCKNKLTDPPASKGNALQQLRVKAAQLGANAVIDISFDQQGTDAWGTNCWESIQVSGMAVRLREQ